MSIVQPKKGLALTFLLTLFFIYADTVHRGFHIITFYIRHLAYNGEKINHLSCLCELSKKIAEIIAQLLQKDYT